MRLLSRPIYQTEQIRELERLAFDRFQLSPHTLMQRAGKAALDLIVRRWPHAHSLAIFCGSGNNGGDGYTLALLAAQHGLKVIVWQVGDHRHLKTEAHDAWLACVNQQVPIYAFDGHTDLQHPDILVDAICGIGVTDPLRDAAALAVEKINRLQLPILSLDIPTGVDANTGSILGCGIRATATVTFIGLKLGLLTGSGIDHTGELVLCDLQLPPDLLSSVLPVAEKIQLHAYRNYLQPRPRDWHKGLSGHVLIIGGERGFAGAVRMAGEAALRVGAGLVTIATHPDNAAMANISCPELMCHGIDDPAELNPFIAQAKVIVIGPGLSQSPWAQAMWKVFSQANKPSVVDADGLNLLAQTGQHDSQWVLTPHPGEAARLLHTSVAVIQQDRLAALKAIQTRYKGVCVLKGAGSLVGGEKDLPGLCDKGNPGMATAGMGDILSGVIGGLMAQGIPSPEAAKLGVYLHAAAGDLATKEGERGMIATDLFPYLRRLSNLPTDEK